MGSRDDLSTIGMYIHFPFCMKKCPYCSFDSIEYKGQEDNTYADVLLKELDNKLKIYPSIKEKILQTIYIGGGTPSLMSPVAAARVIEGIKKAVPWDKDVEITLEVNPKTVDMDKVKGFKRAGVGRFSIGVQSFNDNTLISLGRNHSAEDAVGIYRNARDMGIENIGIDLIFGIPGQGLEEWRRDVEAAVALRPEHVSVYSLSIEDGTPFYRVFGKGGSGMPCDFETINMYYTALKIFSQAGYVHYEISNLALPGFESRHNERYWQLKSYIGLGAGAHSYLSSPRWGRRWWNISEPDVYISSLMRGETVVSKLEELRYEDAVFEAIFLGLRRRKGIVIRDFIERFRISPIECLPMKKLTERGLIFVDGNALKLTSEGIVLSDEIFSYIDTARVVH